ncbi:MAG: glycosyltransferase [Anaerolineales bacterium]|nr:glycosyltransferase [Anaerolineales bacterium]
MPTISVITPTYNRAHLIRESIDSVLQQTFTDFEHIVIDDGSTDETEAVIKQIDDPRLKYIKRENGGASAARNTGLQAATGEWVAFLDSDDLYLPNRLALQMAKGQEVPDAGLVFGQYYSSTAARQEKKLTDACGNAVALEHLLMGPVFHWSTVLIRRSYLQQEGGFDTRFAVGEEWELTLRLALAGAKMVCVSAPLTLVRLQENSLSRDLHKHASSSMGVLDKTFQDARMPAKLMPLKHTAFAARLVKFAASGYISDDPEAGKAYLAWALREDPSLQNQNLPILITKLFGYMFGLSLRDPETTLARMMPHLAGDAAFRKRLSRELWGRYHMDAAFLAHRANNPGQCRTQAFRAFLRNPASLRNRGLLSIFVRSFMGERVFVRTVG